MGTVTRIGILASCLVSISVAMTIVQTTTSEVPPETPSETPPDTTFIITTPPGCENKPKPVDEGPCTPCECQSDGEWVCMIIDCVVAPCVDPRTEPNQCCSTCPTGPNCMIEGKIVSFDSPEVMPDGRLCYCVQDQIWSPPSYKCDLNTPPTEETTTSPGCLNEPKPDEGPCAFCDCVNDGGSWKWTCYYRDCMRPQCDDYYTPPGECCPVCKERASCDINGIIVSVDDYIETPDDQVCFCVQNGMDETIEVKCMPRYTSPPPPPTTTEESCLNQPKPDNGPCAYCECLNDGRRWRWMCYQMMCMRPYCYDYYTPPGACCPICKDPPGCKIDEIIIPAGESRVNQNGEMCYCEQPGYPVYCEPVTTTPQPPTTTTPPGCREEDKPTGPCYSYCECANWSGTWQWECPHPTCPPPPCADPTTSPDRCCPYCTNGANCDVNGVLVPVNSFIETPSGDVCYCVQPDPRFFWEGVGGYIGKTEVQCMPKSTTPMITLTPDRGCLDQPPPPNSPCAHCECVDWSGRWEWQCYHSTCMMPECVDPTSLPGGCCLMCENGPNCLINGQIVAAGDVLVGDSGEICYCAFSEESKFICEPPPLTTIEPPPPPDTTIQPTTPADCDPAKKPSESPCTSCECARWMDPPDWVCMYASCLVPPCVDSTNVPNQCCPVCPNGPNCQAGDVIIPVNDVRRISDNVVCQCLQSSPWDVPTAVCMTETTTSTTTP